MVLTVVLLTEDRQAQDQASWSSCSVLQQRTFEKIREKERRRIESEKRLSRHRNICEQVAGVVLGCRPKNCWIFEGNGGGYRTVGCMGQQKSVTLDDGVNTALNSKRKPKDPMPVTDPGHRHTKRCPHLLAQSRSFSRPAPCAIRHLNAPTSPCYSSRRCARRRGESSSGVSMRMPGSHLLHPNTFIPSVHSNQSLPCPRISL